MNYSQLQECLLGLPGATADWLAYTLSHPDDGRPLPTSYSLVRRGTGAFEVYQGDERGGVSIAKADDGKTPLAFPSEEAACAWIWGQVLWWREFEARRAGSRENEGR
ncbi:MAG: hypothetical protein J0I43_09660 [Microbacterium sp.]|uniref:hypothetical protein n=1 Tax=Microbacterium sp. TaxID=51671 RepID=UPI001AC60634|nr:hypothetical protein [Microbacterium sp.]MBN9177617.1 hypothetical protein [Microbacterium sp.]